MANLSSSSRLKVNRDTCFLPEPGGGVYFRNNHSSFRMEGSTIYQWVEKLMPMFDGERTIGELTIGLTEPYRNRVFEIGGILYKNGFVQDQSQNKEHQLSKKICAYYNSQIEFIENFTDSGAYNFQKYRQTKVLVIGSGSMLTATVSSLLESGLPKFHLMITDSTNKGRIEELTQNAKKNDNDVEIGTVPEVNIKELNGWKEAVNPYDWILYVSEKGNIDEVRNLNRICKSEKKAFLPIVCLERIGLAGPLVTPESDSCWESAWRRIHQTAILDDNKSPVFSNTAGAILANVCVFELFKKVTGVAGEIPNTQMYLMNPDTLEGGWISYFNHPLTDAEFEFVPQRITDIEKITSPKKEGRNSNGNLFDFFSRITSAETGIFHVWEEKDLKQLPLSQCMIQVVNPLSEGPAQVLPVKICAGLTHDEAKKEAGFAGIEMYVSKFIGSSFIKTDERFSNRPLGIGAGETIAEGVCRGLQGFLENELTRKEAGHRLQIKIGKVEDRHCRFFLESLKTINGDPTISMEEDLFGFPVINIHSGNRWYTKTGLNLTLALRNALKIALMDLQNPTNFKYNQALKPAVLLKKSDHEFFIPSCEEKTAADLLTSARDELKRRNTQLLIYDLTVDPFIKQHLSGVYGVMLLEGES